MPSAARLPDAALRATGLSAGYHRHPVVHHINLEVRAGELVTLLGANGAGKTTTLLALSGYLPAMAGTVELSGASTSSPLHRRARNGLGFITERSTVFSRLTVEQNLQVAGCDPDRAIGYFPELKPLLRRRGGLLSGGEQRMLSAAAVLARGPRVILADELSLGLAPLIVRRLLRVLREAADAGVAILLVEQHVREALAVADRAYVMRRGSIAMTASAEEMLERIEEVEEAYLAGARPPREARSASRDLAPGLEVREAEMPR